MLSTALSEEPEDNSVGSKCFLGIIVSYLHCGWCVHTLQGFDYATGVKVVSKNIGEQVPIPGYFCAYLIVTRTGYNNLYVNIGQTNVSFVVHKRKFLVDSILVNL